jgi:uncharacterized membrane-anchored protein
MRILASALLLGAFGITPVTAKSFDEIFPDASYENAGAQAFLKGLDYRQGKIKLSEARVTLSVPPAYYFLDQVDARKVLVDAWGNPPAAADGVLGMLFPTKLTPIDEESWGATITYAADGYVGDDDAGSLDYHQLLADMKASTAAGNEERTKAGYESITLVGWASPPYYDRRQHKLHWARELRFGDAALNTVNYDVRALGRNGVLEFSFITDVSRLIAVKAAIPDVLAMASFDPGSRYEDYDSSIDKVAAYGIGGLIAGAAVKKLGLLAGIVVAAKKLWFVAAAVLLGALAVVWRRRAGRRRPAAVIPPAET